MYIEHSPRVASCYMPSAITTHSSCRTHPPPLMDSERYDPRSNHTRHFRLQYQDYANSLKHASICIFDSSIVRKMIRKFSEALMAGCVVASDLPHEMWSELEESIITLPHNGSPQEIAAIINSFSRRPSALEELRRKGHALALERLSCEARLETLWRNIQAYKRGRRGIFLRSTTAIDCQNFLPLRRPKNKMMTKFHASYRALPWCPFPSTQVRSS